MKKASSTQASPKISSEEYQALQQPYSKATIKNYLGMICAAQSYDGPLSLLLNMFFTFVYTEYMGVPALTITSIVAVSIIIDGITDLLMGMVTDRVRTKYGKMRHWFLWTALPLAAVGGLVWTPPVNAPEAIKVVYIFVIYNVFCTLVTMVRIPGAASYTLCTDSDQVRGKLIWIVSVSTSLLSYVANWLVNPMLNAFGGGLAAYRTMGWIFAAFTFVMLNIAFFLTRETRKKGDWEEKDEEFKQLNQRVKRENILEQYGYLLRNKWWVILMLSKIAGGLVMGFSMAVQAYYLQYVLGSMEYMGMFATTKLFMMGGAFASVLFVNRIDARNMSILMYAIKSVCLIGAFLFAKNVWVVVACLCAGMVTDGLIQPANGIIISRVVDYGEWKHGIRQEGLCNSGQSVMGRIGNAIATVVLGIVLTAFNYTGAGTVTPACANAFQFMYLGIPAICAVLNLVIFCFMKLDGKTVERYREEIAQRKASAESASSQE